MLTGASAEIRENRYPASMAQCDANGSDTPDGQRIVTDFLFGLSASPYYLTNQSYPGVSGAF